MKGESSASCALNLASNRRPPPPSPRHLHSRRSFIRLPLPLARGAFLVVLA